MTHTRTIDADPSGPRQQGTQSDAVLIVLLECGRPTAGSTRHRLTALQQVTLGRGPERSAVRQGTTLELLVPDAAMSSSHARLSLSHGRWIIEDQGSKNGSTVNGAKLRRALLHPGDLVEAGTTLFLFDTQPVGPFALDTTEDDAAALLDGGPTTFSSTFATHLSLFGHAAKQPFPMVLQGPSGAGLQTLARLAHQRSGRTGPLVSLSCMSLTAQQLAQGLEDAARGTLLLGELSELAPALQLALLEHLRAHESGREAARSARILATSHQDLEAKVAEHVLREDLFARLSGFTARVPPLASRRCDLGLLIAALLRPRKGEGPRQWRFTLPAARALVEHAWPRNLRELVQVLSLAQVAAVDGLIDVAQVPQLTPQRVAAPRPEASADDDARRDELTRLLQAHGGNVSEVARAMGKARTQVQRWLKRYGLQSEQFKR
ncbi:MAG: sigma 54-interacting transcriptional regulator [Myxococcaceae bacterium]|nr:sigma 54-interacting transcriptional regulator [Myxococcaceae bacterium]